LGAALVVFSVVCFLGAVVLGAAFGFDAAGFLGAVFGFCLLVSKNVT